MREPIALITSSAWLLWVSHHRVQCIWLMMGANFIPLAIWTVRGSIRFKIYHENPHSRKAKVMICVYFISTMVVSLLINQYNHMAFMNIWQHYYNLSSVSDVNLRPGRHVPSLIQYDHDKLSLVNKKLGIVKQMKEGENARMDSLYVSLIAR